MKIQERIKTLQVQMIDKKVDMAAIGPTSSMRYLLEFAPFADERLCVLIIGIDSVSMIVPDLNAEETAAHTTVKLIPWKDSEGPQKAVQQIREINRFPGMLAVDPAMRADNLLQLLNGLNPDKVITIDELISPLRLVKSDHEIDLLQQAAWQADKAMQAAVDACVPGATEKEVVWAAESAFRKNGAEEVCFTIVASGPNGAHPHHRSRDREIRKGDPVIIDIGASFQGYKSDITRMVHLGTPDPDVLKVYDTVKHANRKAFSFVQPGVAAEDIDLVARNHLEEAGYGKAFLHRTGHGIGLDVHEPPWIMAGNKSVLQAGMVFSIEPGVYLPGKFGVRVEDIVVVTHDGVRNLTGFDHSLVVKQ